MEFNIFEEEDVNVTVHTDESYYVIAECGARTLFTFQN